MAPKKSGVTLKKSKNLVSCRSNLPGFHDLFFCELQRIKRKWQNMDWAAITELFIDMTYLVA